MGSTVKGLTWGVAILAVAAIVAWATHERLHRRAEQRALAERQSVRELPPGVRDAWAAYVERRVAASIERRADGLALIGAVAPGVKPPIVPPGAPFQVECDTLNGGATVVFTPDGAAIAAPIFGPRAALAKAQASPPLGVDRQSLAAVGLSDFLCQEVFDQVNAIAAARPWGRIRKERLPAPEIHGAAAG